MLKVRVIPTLLWKGQGLAKGVGFDSWRRVGSVVPAVRVYNARDVDELILVDVEAYRQNRCPDHETVSDFSDECSIPLTVGGGVKTTDDFSHLLKAGADKIAVNSHLYKEPSLVDKAANLFGSQCVVVSIDVKRQDDGSYMCFSHSGGVCENKTVLDWALEVEARGAGEILLTSIERDGTMSGYDLELISQISGRVKIPVIASGGAGTYEHMIEAVKQGGASAVAAASIFHFTELTPRGARKALGGAGIAVRNS